MIITLIQILALVLNWTFAFIYPEILSRKRGVSYRDSHGWRALGWAFGIISNSVSLGSNIYQHKSNAAIVWDIFTLAIVIMLFVVYFRMWRNNRKNKKRLRQLLGAKAKALLKSVTDVMDKINEGVRQPLPARA